MQSCLNLKQDINPNILIHARCLAFIFCLNFGNSEESGIPGAVGDRQAFDAVDLTETQSERIAGLGDDIGLHR